LRRFTKGNELIEFLDWLARAGGVIVVLTTVLGFMFREKWKQILQRSLAEDLERLKSELAKKQVEHAASLTPQLEQIKHDFQQKLEAYKVSLIAEAEAVKAKGELRKNIALRYAEIEFQRLVELEHILSSIASEILSMATVAAEYKLDKNRGEAIELMHELGRAMNGAGMYLTTEERLGLSRFRKTLVDIMATYIGPGAPVLPDDDKKATDLGVASTRVQEVVQKRIQALAKL
jgi:hypothetical protein